MSWKRKNVCPECKGKLTEFGLNIDAGTIECLKCHAQFCPLNVFRDSDIVSFSKQLPVDKQEAFLTGLGFEKEPAHRTSETLLYGFLTFLMLGSVSFSLMLAVTGHWITFLSPIIGGLILCYATYDIYKSEEVYRWRRSNSYEAQKQNKER